MNKENLRIKYKYIRNSIKNKNLLSEKITQNIINSDFYKNSNCIGVFVSLEQEVSTSNLLLSAFSDKKIICVPVVQGMEINFYKISSFNDLSNTGNFGIKEPCIHKSNLISSQNIDLLIVPGICFDLYGNRVGYGKGFYDRFMVNLDAYKLGTCFEEQLIKNEIITTEKTDIPVNSIITEGGFYECKTK